MKRFNSVTEIISFCCWLVRVTNYVWQKNEECILYNILHIQFYNIYLIQIDNHDYKTSHEESPGNLLWHHLNIPLRELLEDIFAKLYDQISTQTNASNPLVISVVTYDD